MVIALDSLQDNSRLRRSIFDKEAASRVPDYQNMVLPPNEVLLPQVLKTQGYRNYYLGKWHLGESDGFLPWDRGYDDSLTFLKGASMYLPKGHPDVINARKSSTRATL